MQRDRKKYVKKTAFKVCMINLEWYRQWYIDANVKK